MWRLVLVNVDLEGPRQFEESVGMLRGRGRVGKPTADIWISALRGMALNQGFGIFSCEMLIEEFAEWLCMFLDPQGPIWLLEEFGVAQK